MEKRLERQARNEALIREVNERIGGLEHEAASLETNRLLEFLCECGRKEVCDVTVEVTLQEYERVRTEDDRFLLAPGHETDELERIVEQTDRYVIVDKVADAEAFVRDDPRGAPSR